GVGEEPALVGSIGSAAVEMAEHSRGGDKDDVEAAATGFVSERLRQVRFADAGGTLNKHGLVALHESARRQIEDLLTIDRGVKREIETFKGLAQIDRGAPQPELQLLLCAPFDFVLDEPLEEIDVRQLLGDRLLRAHLERRQDARQPQIFQFRHELVIQLHDPPPVGGKKSVTGRAKSGRAGVTVNDATDGTAVWSSPRSIMRLSVP